MRLLAGSLRQTVTLALKALHLELHYFPTELILFDIVMDQMRLKHFTTKNTNQ
jgi:hypothetical protein